MDTEDLSRPKKINAYSVEHFAESHGVSRSQVFVEIKNHRLRTMKVGRRRLISDEAAADWRLLMEDQAALPS